jgi:hypothetical protein
MPGLPPSLFALRRTRERLAMSALAIPIELKAILFRLNQASYPLGAPPLAKRLRMRSNRLSQTSR